MFRQLATLILLALIPASISGLLQLQWKTDDPLLPGEVRADTARLWGSHVLWVDARGGRRFQIWHVPGAVPLDQEGWPDQVTGFFAAWANGKTVVVYGEDGNDPSSAKIADRITRELKIEPVYVLKGGRKVWRP